MARTRPSSAQRSRGVTASRVAACAGVSANLRGKWAKAGLVRPGPQLTSNDAVETAILAILAKINQKAAPDVWLRARGQVRGSLLQGTDTLWIVVSACFTVVHVTMEPADAARLASGISNGAHVVNLTEAIADARGRFDGELRRVSRQSESGPSVVRQIRR
jgi:hypothetical protein